jgi:hypothetical protein
MEKDQDNTIECGNCGALTEITASRCSKCGAKLFESDLDASTATSKKKQVRSPVAPVSVKRQVTPKNDESEDDLDDWPQLVSIVDFDMPFLSLVFFMVKVAIASIPALIILGALFAILVILFGGTLSVLFNNF